MLGNHYSPLDDSSPAPGRDLLNSSVAAQVSDRELEVPVDQALQAAPDQVTQVMLDDGKLQRLRLLASDRFRAALAPPRGA